MKELDFIQKQVLLKKMADEYGIDIALTLMFGGDAKIRLRVPEYVYELQVDTLPLDTRSLNAAKRARLFTVGELMDSLAEGGYIKGAGVRSRSEYFGCILRYTYGELTTAKQYEFLDDVILHNVCLIYVKDGETE